MLNVTCRACSASLTLPDRVAGQETVCLFCGERFMVPAQGVPVASPLQAKPPPIPQARVEPAPPLSPQSNPFEVVNTPASLVRRPAARRGLPLWVFAVLIPAAVLVLFCVAGIGGLVWWKGSTGMLSAPVQPKGKQAPENQSKQASTTAKPAPLSKPPVSEIKPKVEGEPKVWDRADFNKLVWGMTAEQVLNTVGRPDSTKEYGGNVYWYYLGRTRDPFSGKVDQSVEIMIRGGIGGFVGTMNYQSPAPKTEQPGDKGVDLTVIFQHSPKKSVAMLVKRDSPIPPGWQGGPGRVLSLEYGQREGPLSSLLSGGKEGQTTSITKLR